MLEHRPHLPHVARGAAMRGGLKNHQWKSQTAWATGRKARREGVPSAGSWWADCDMDEFRRRQAARQTDLRRSEFGNTVPTLGVDEPARR